MKKIMLGLLAVLINKLGFFQFILCALKKAHLGKIEYTSAKVLFWKKLETLFVVFELCSFSFSMRNKINKISLPGNPQSGGTGFCLRKGR